MELNATTLIIAAALALAALIMWPFMSPLIFGLVVAYILYPTHLKISKKMPRKLSALMLTTISFLVVSGLLIYGGGILLNEFAKMYVSVLKFDTSQVFSAGSPMGDALKEASQLLISKLINSVSSLLSALPKALVSLFLFFATVYYALVSGPNLWVWMEKKLPFKSETKKRIVKNIESYTRAFVYVWLTIALAQAIIAGFGFYIFGYNSPILFALLAGLLSFIPLVGPYILYLPVGILAIQSGNANAGIGLIIYGLAIGSILDYIIRPHYAGKLSEAHPFLVLIGLLGGLSLLGPVGLIVGPMILLVALAVIEGYGI